MAFQVFWFMSPQWYFSFIIIRLVFINGAFRVALVVKNLPASEGDARDVGSVPGSGRSPGLGNSNLLHYFCHGKYHGQRTLVGYGPWGHKESDTLSNWTHTHGSALFFPYFWLRWVFVAAYTGFSFSSMRAVEHVGSVVAAQAPLVAACGLSICTTPASLPTACGILVPWPRIEPVSPAIWRWILNHWTTKEIPKNFYRCFLISNASKANWWSSCFVSQRHWSL